MESKEAIEKFYSQPDPWGFQSHPDDQKRKDLIIEELGAFGFFRNALDIGAGEGWITKEIPAEEIYALELSDKAKARFPKNITAISEPKGEYDLILATGILYDHYDIDRFIDIINNHSGGLVLTCNIAEWESSKIERINLEEVTSRQFPYREYTQRLRIFTK